jgi:hypothetical protein
VVPDSRSVTVAPRSPHVMATACASQRSQSRSAWMLRSSVRLKLVASAALGVTNALPGTGSAPAGWGSHTKGI